MRVLRHACVAARRRAAILGQRPHGTLPLLVPTPYLLLCRCSKQRKQLAKDRKARTVKHFNVIQEVTALWEQARRHDASPEKRAKLISAILAKAKGLLAELAGSHTASRVIQTCAKYGTDEGERSRCWAGGGRRCCCLEPALAQPHVVAATLSLPRQSARPS